MRILRDVAVVVVVLAALGAALVIYASITTVSVHNKSNESLSDLKIGITGKVLWQGDLRAGDSKLAFGMPSHDGGAAISYVANDLSHQVECGYVTGGLSRTSISIDILPDGLSNCQQSY